MTPFGEDRFDLLRRLRGADTDLTNEAADVIEQMLTEASGMQEALRYIACPTMGYDGSMTPEEFAGEKATERNARLALQTCIRTAAACEAGQRHDLAESLHGAVTQVKVLTHWLFGPWVTIHESKAADLDRDLEPFRG